MTTHFTITKTEHLPDSRILIEGEIAESALVKHREGVIQKLSTDADIPGFRKGKVPEAMIIERVGEMHILSEAAEEALNEEYPKIIDAQKIFVLGQPEIKITKLAPGSPLGFSLTVGILPDFSLPNYKTIAREVMAKEESADVTEKDITMVIEEIQKNYAHRELHKKLGLSETDHNHEDIKIEDLPPITDDFVKTIGDFSDVADFKKKIEENLVREKGLRLREKKRMEILEKVLAETSVTVPDVLVQSEIQKMLAQFQDDVARAGANYEEYLKHAKKTEEEIKNEWRETAEKKAKVQLILNKISEEEKLSPDNEKVRTETEKILMVHQGADPVRARLYVAQMFLNEVVMEFLENQE
jgi:FKBP-type peptidyl-prolyl cis-trans isomerase (trigger factor)